MPNKKNEVDIEDYRQSILNYGNQIEHIDSFVEAVRRFPGMYIGDKGNFGWLSCIREIYQNAVDEAIKVDSPCHFVNVIFDERNQSATIEDTGRGIPHGKMFEIYGTEHSSSNYSKKAGQYTSGVHGVGSGVAMSLSDDFIVDSYVLGTAHEIRFKEGQVWNKGELVIKCPKGRQGSKIFMTPSKTALGQNIFLTCQDVFNLVFKIYPLTNVGDEIDFTGINVKGETVINEHLINKDGMITDLIVKTQAPIVPPIIFSEDNGQCRAEIAFTYDSADITAPESITSFANFTPTVSGTHINGFLSGLCNFFRNYMNKIYLGEKSKITVINSDIKSGLKAIIVSAALNPVFKGQFKGTLSNEEMEPFVQNLITNGLESWSKTHPNEIQKLCKYFKDIAEIRSKSDDSKIKLSTKYNKNLLSGKPAKYVQPSGHKELELIIVEGDSALGSARNSRDSSRQGLFPIRGKLPNAFNTSKANFLNNSEVASIIDLVGGGYGKNFDIDKVKWDKVIFFADADPDGAHINTLLLRLFLLYMPELISVGKVYRSVPPLFGVKIGKKNKYFTNKLDFTKYVQALFSSNHSLTTTSNIKLSSVESTGLFYKNADYAYELEVLSNTYAIDISLLEFIMYRYAPYIELQNQSDVGNGLIISDKNNDEDFIPTINDNVCTMEKYSISKNFNFNAFKKSIEKEFRFITVDKAKKGNDIYIKGLVNSRYQYVFINQKFISGAAKFIRILQSNNALMYKIDGKLSTLYEIMSAFNASTPNGLTRFKGLGEQDPVELGESALRPDSSRTLIRYTIEDVKQEIEMIRYIDSNKVNLFKDITITRQDIE